MPDGLGSGTPVIQHGRHGIADSDAGTALVAECGQHFLQATADVAVAVTLDFLAHFGLIEARPAKQHEPQRRYRLLQTYVVKTPEFRFTRPVVGFETFAAGELIATDGSTEIRAPEDCTILMPTRKPIVGREGVYLARRLAT
jgi:succinylglutamate desuccinylase